MSDTEVIQGRITIDQETPQGRWRLQTVAPLRGLGIDTHHHVVPEEPSVDWASVAPRTIGVTVAITATMMTEDSPEDGVLYKVFNLEQAPATIELTDERDSLKMVRETLCVAQTAVAAMMWELDDDLDRTRLVGHADRIQRMIAEIDGQRPLGADGTHGDLHTETCGCEDRG